MRVDELERLPALVAARSATGDSTDEFALPETTYEELLENLGGDEDLLAEVAAIWCRQSEESLHALQRALDQLDHAELARLTHKIGGTVLALGDQRLAAAGQELNQAAQGEADRARIESSGRRFVRAFHSLTLRLARIATVETAR